MSSNIHYQMSLQAKQDIYTVKYVPQVQIVLTNKEGLEGVQESGKDQILPTSHFPTYFWPTSQFYSQCCLWLPVTQILFSQWKDRQIM